MSTRYQRPILTSIFYVLGVLSLIGALLCLFQSFLAAITVGVVGIIYFGIGQAVDYLARIAHATERQCFLLELANAVHQKDAKTNTVGQRNIRSAFPRSGLDTSPPPQGYYFSTDGQEQGPLIAADLKSMRRDGLIFDDTPVLREGESQWQMYRDFSELSK